MTDLSLSGAIFSTSKYSKTRFRPGAPSRLGRGTPPPHSFPPRRLRRLDLGAFGASVVRPPTQIPGYAYGAYHVSSQTESAQQRLLPPPLVSPKFSHVPPGYVDGLWATKSEGVELNDRAISLQAF